MQILHQSYYRMKSSQFFSPHQASGASEEDDFLGGETPKNDGLVGMTPCSLDSNPMSPCSVGSPPATFQRPF